MRASQKVAVGWRCGAICMDSLTSLCCRVALLGLGPLDGNMSLGNALICMGAQTHIKQSKHYFLDSHGYSSVPNP